MRPLNLSPVRKTTVMKAAATAAGLVLLLSGCGQSNEADEAGESGALAVVTSTNVYGQIVEAVGGAEVQVTSLIETVSQDPHSYEATVRDKLAVSKADLVVENGGGYDTFLHRLVDDTGVDPAHVLSAVEVSGLMPEENEPEHGEHDEAEAEHEPEHGEDQNPAHEHGTFNEHVWYSLDAATSVAEAVAAKLGELDPAHADIFTANAQDFTAGVSELQGRLAELPEAPGGDGVAITEPVPLYLLQDAGLDNKTPSEFSQAVEAGNEVSPLVLQETRELLMGSQVRFLAYNEQTAGPQTIELRNVAEKSGVPVVNFTETLPPNTSYIGWMQSNIDNIERALTQQ